MTESKNFYKSMASILNAVGEITHDGDFDKWADSMIVVREIPKIKTMFTSAAKAFQQANTLSNEQKQQIEQAVREEIGGDDEALLEDTVLLVQHFMQVVKAYADKFRKK
jgi:hypothetical protein